LIYNPQKKTRRQLERAMWHINSVPYKVSLRWTFYRLWDEGLFSTAGKKAKLQAYEKFKDYSRKARKAFYGEWRPYTLADDNE